MIKAVFLDFYNTLVHFSPMREDVQARACSSFGIQTTPDGLARGYALADAYMDSENAGDLPLARRSQEEQRRFFAEYERLILQGAGVDVDLPTAGRIWDNVLRVPHGLALYDDVLPALDLLRLREMTLGVLSNINRDMETLSQELGLAPYLDFTVTSGEVGRGKPHPPIFLAALERAGVVEPREVLHVGDSYASDVLGARGVGIHPLLLDRDGTQTHVTDCPRISSLMEVVEHLG
ncbi:MAG: HAD family hydrolase [Chloroflexi bacterium]|nr:HAD family hydrolase [Chloroflexota bacterium]